MKLNRKFQAFFLRLSPMSLTKLLDDFADIDYRGGFMKLPILDLHIVNEVASDTSQHNQH